MPIASAPVTTVINFTAAELELLGDAIALLCIKKTRRNECVRFLGAHPEFDLLYDGPEPEPAEDR